MRRRQQTSDAAITASFNTCLQRPRRRPRCALSIVLCGRCSWMRPCCHLPPERRLESRVSDGGRAGLAASVLACWLRVLCSGRTGSAARSDESGRASLARSRCCAVVDAEQPALDDRHGDDRHGWRLGRPKGAAATRGAPAGDDSNGLVMACVMVPFLIYECVRPAQRHHSQRSVKRGCGGSSPTNLN